MRKWLGIGLVFSLLLGGSIGPVSANTGNVRVEQEWNDDMGNPNEAFVGDEVQGALTTGDKDYFLINVPFKGGFSLYGMIDSETKGVKVDVYRKDGGGALYAGEGVQDGNVFYYDKPLNPGQYFVIISTEEGTSYNGENYSFITEITRPEITRIEGVNRYETAANIAFDGWLGNVDEVVLATGQDFPDALAAGPLAYHLDAPILLTTRDALPAPTLNFIKNKGVKRVTLIGGTGAISQKTEDYLRKTLNLTVTRIAGNDRFQTAALIANKLPDLSAAVVVNGRNYPDALSVSPIAAYYEMPILLTETNTLPAATANVLKNVDETLVIGGTGVVSNAVAGKLPDPGRIGGKDRYETSLLVAELMPSFSALVATGANFADALSGSVVAANSAQPIILTPPSGIRNVKFEMIEGLRNLEIIDYTILGGTGAVSNQVEEDLRFIIDNFVYFF